MKTLSLCMIVKNEEKTLARVLENGKEIVDEIIVVDTGSTDGTKQIAYRFTDKVFDFQWNDDFANARNFSFDMAKCEYIIWLDGDDFLSNESIEKIKKWKNEEGSEDVLMCAYALTFDQNLTPSYLFLRERIVKNSPLLRWQERVHEVIVPCGKIVNRPDIIIYHGKQKEYTNRNLKIYQKMIKNGEKLSPRGKFYYARELFYNGFYKGAISQFKKFLKEKNSFIENKIDAYKIMSYCYEILGDSQKALESLFQIFLISPVRGEIAYEIGRILNKQKRFDMGRFWLEVALSHDEKIESGGFVDKRKTTLFPALELVVCCYQLKDYTSSRHYHEIAKGFDENDNSVIFNEKFFKNLENR